MEILLEVLAAQSALAPGPAVLANELLNGSFPGHELGGHRPLEVVLRVAAVSRRDSGRELSEAGDEELGERLAGHDEAARHRRDPGRGRRRGRRAGRCRTGRGEVCAATPSPSPT